MPTASKLVAAVLLAVLGYFAADRVAAHLPEEIPPGMIRPVMAFFGIMVGWRFLGKRVGDGYSAALGMGLSSSVVLFLLGMGWFAGVEMIKRSMRMSYDNPFHALQGMVEIAIDNVEHVTYVDVISILVAGGILVGLLVEFASRRWS